MSFSKHFYSQFGKDIDKEVVNYKAHGESRSTTFKRCKHKQVKVENGQVRCACGAAWRGPRIAELYNLLKGGEYDRRRKSTQRSTSL